MSTKTALITGSSKGIGAAIASGLSEAGYQVFLTGRDEEQLKQQSAKCKNAEYLVLDILEPNAPENLIQRATQSLGRINVLVNNAGCYEWGAVTSPPATLPKENGDQFSVVEKLFKLNAQIPLELCSLVVPQMKEQKSGRIINIGSISGVVGEPNASLYSASKASLIGLTKSLALELAEFGITVNLVNPGWVKTSMMSENLSKEEQTKELETIPQKRWIEPQEVAYLVRFLVSDKAKGITGQSINICAGLSLG
ncbi:MAG: SDR family oxidoreductase [Candidatus Caenarcaniphilales bacterium]|nr:SDR family oxidoreductase [Candidatus Caenarcaniphilales bacterium]